MPYVIDERVVCRCIVSREADHMRHRCAHGIVWLAKHHNDYNSTKISGD